MAAVTNMQCVDILEFKDALQKMRIIDDKIVYALNNSIPTESFKGQVDSTKMCKDLYAQLTSNYSHRDKAIKGCITVTAERVKKYREQREAEYNSVDVLQRLRKEQTHLRLLQSELHIEEVTQNRTNKIYYERCRPFYKPPELNIID